VTGNFPGFPPTNTTLVISVFNVAYTLKFISKVDRHSLQLGHDCLEFAPQRAGQLSCVE
jgi:hypothetical protein